MSPLKWLTDEKRRAVAGWCMYDWANSAFAVVVLTAFFPFLFKSFWDGSADAALNTARLGLGDSISGLLVAFLSPVLGALADAGRAKKAFLTFFMLLGVLMTGAIWFAGAGAWQTAVALFILANIGFACGNLFYDSLLVDVSHERNMDFVSSVGYATGYAGGGLLYGIVVLLVWFWKDAGFTGQIQAARAGFPMVAGWWLVFSLPLLLLVKERSGAGAGPVSVIKGGLSRLKSTAVKIASNRLYLLFIVAFWLYMDGVYTVITMSVNFGLSIGIGMPVLMITILLVQFVAFPAALGYGYLARSIGGGRGILLGIAAYIVVCTVGFFVLKNAVQFVVLACCVGMVQGGVQALSRSYFAKIVPAEDAAEYFGFLNLISRFSIVLGPLLVGGTTLACRRLGFGGALSQRLGMASITVLFVAGGILLLFAERKRPAAGKAA
jgi:MFS transporter, UMF1 family